MTYRVSSPYVTVKVKDPAGSVVVKGFYAGSILPDEVDEENVQILVDGEMVEKVTQEESAQDSSPVFDKPHGNAGRDAWATYALESGQASEDEIKDLSRDDLRERYGN